mmetsp:Transcript_30058/g.39555  ORF Transcript_30058/g.39555 Transcript_30058/m.39555 type:complete len:330 (-) Transcript_30058:120-1109(-)
MMHFRKSSPTSEVRSSGSFEEDEDFLVLENKKGKQGKGGTAVQLFREDRAKVVRKTSFSPADFRLSDHLPPRPSIDDEAAKIFEEGRLSESNNVDLPIILQYGSSHVNSLACSEYESDIESDTLSVLSNQQTPKAASAGASEEFNELSGSEFSGISDDEENELEMNRILREFEKDVSIKSKPMTMSEFTERSSNTSIRYTPFESTSLSDWESSDEDQDKVGKYFSFEEHDLSGEESFVTEAKKKERMLKNIARKAKYSVKRNLEYIEAIFLLAVWLIALLLLIRFSGLYEEMKIILAALSALLAIPCIVGIFIYRKENQHIQQELKRKV